MLDGNYLLKHDSTLTEVELQTILSALVRYSHDIRSEGREGSEEMSRDAAMLMEKIKKTAKIALYNYNF